MNNEAIILANLIILIYLAIHFTRKLNNLEDKINDLNLIICYLVDPESTEKVVKDIHIEKD